MYRTILVTAAFRLLTLPALAAPALSDKPPKWEYCELQVQRTFLPVVGQQVQPRVAEMTIRFTTGDEEITTKTWEELATKLKAPAPKKEGTENVHRLRVFNRLGVDGWEPMERTGPTTATGVGTWMFKRRVP